MSPQQIVDITRRDFLTTTASGLGALAFASLLKADGLLGAEAKHRAQVLEVMQALVGAGQFVVSVGGGHRDSDSPQRARIVVPTTAATARETPKAEPPSW